MSIGERITELRTQNNMTQYELAKIMNVSRQAVSKWESDKAAPDVMNLIHLADILDSDVEYLATGRRNYGRRPPVVVETVKTVEKIVEKPVVKFIEKPIDRIIEKPVVEYVEKPVIKKVIRTKYVRNPMEILIYSAISAFVGILIGILLPL